MSINIVADMNTHTMASDNAYSTLIENIGYARKHGMKAIAMTDHGPAMKGAPDISHFKDSVHTLPDSLEGISLIKGVEANIISTVAAKVDVDDDTLHDLDWVIASYYPVITSISPMPSVMTATYIDLLRNPFITVLGHPARYNKGFDIYEVVSAWRDAGRAIEIDEATLKLDDETIARTVQIAIACKELGANIVVNSDSHYAGDLGRFNLVLKMLEQINFPEKLILNSDYEKLMDYISEFNYCKRNIPKDRKGRPIHR